MNPWEILNIEETTDKKAIKRAYAKLIKTCHPEEDSNKFQEIRSAYEEALAQVNYKNWVNSLPETEVDENDENKEPQEIENKDEIEINLNDLAESYSDSDKTIYKTTNTTSNAFKILDRIKASFPNHSYKNNIDIWKEIFDSEELWNIDTKSLFSDILFEYLHNCLKDPNNNRIQLNSQIWILIEEKLNWLTNEMRFYHTYPEESVDLVLDPIRNAKGKKTSREIIEKSYTKETLDTISNNNKRPWYLAPFFLLLLFKLILYLFRSADNSDNRYKDRYINSYERLNSQYLIQPSQDND